jgi:hypothetical protein
MLSKARFPLMALGMLALLTALWGGLVRLGWSLPVPWPTLFIAHGPLMVCGFLGTLIGVERAVALGAVWPYAAPLLTAVGTLALLSGLPAPPLMTLDVHFISSLPVRQGNAYTAWVDSTPVQMVWGGD